MTYPTPDIWYQFEQNGDDSSGSGNDATPVGSPTYGTGPPNRGFCKGPESGDGNYYTAPDIGITGDDKWTFAMWLYLGTGYPEHIFEYGQDLDYRRICLVHNSTNTLQMRHYDFNANLSKSFPEDEWFHITLVYDTSTNVVKVYYNGVYEEQYGCSNRAIVFSYHTVCRANWTSNDMFTGSIDDYMVWADVALDAGQVADVYADVQFGEVPTSFTSSQDGEWDDGDTWGYPASAGGWYPNKEGDTVTMTHTVTYSISADVELGQVDINSGGTLSFAPTANTRIQFGNNHLIVADGGTLSVGTSADVIQKEYTAELVWNTTTDNTYGPNNQNGSILNVYGDPDYFGNTIDTALLSAGDGTAVILTEDDMSAKWNIGDEIIIGKGDVYNSWPTDALHTTIVGLSGTSMECADAVSSDFKSGGWIVHLTRNVEFYKLGYDRSPRAGNSLRPRWYAGSGIPIMNVSNCSIAAFRRMTYFRGTFNNIVIRNTTDGLYYPYGGSYYNCIWFSSYRAFM